MPPISPLPKSTTKVPPLVRLLLLIGIVLIVAVMLIQKNQPLAVEKNLTDQTAEVRFDQYLESGQPVFLFFHSNNCQSCIEMIAIVDVVYPEFADTIALVDVDVYDKANQNLLQRAKVYSIPTQIFIDSSGQGKVLPGVMSPDDLRSQLNELVK